MTSTSGINVLVTRHLKLCGMLLTLPMVLAMWQYQTSLRSALIVRLEKCQPGLFHLQINELNHLLRWYIATWSNFPSNHITSSGYGTICLLRAKSDTARAFSVWVTWAEKQWSASLLQVHSDRGGEFMATIFRSFLTDKGVQHQLSVVNHPQQNGRAE